MNAAADLEWTRIEADPVLKEAWQALNRAGGPLPVEDAVREEMPPAEEAQTAREFASLWEDHVDKAHAVLPETFAAFMESFSKTKGSKDDANDDTDVLEAAAARCRRHTSCVGWLRERARAVPPGRAINNDTSKATGSFTTQIWTAVLQRMVCCRAFAALAESYSFLPPLVTVIL